MNLIIPTVLRPDEAGKYLSLSAQRLAKLRLEGDGPKFAKVGRTVLYCREDLDTWLQTRRRASTSDPAINPSLPRLP